MLCYAYTLAFQELFEPLRRARATYGGDRNRPNQHCRDYRSAPPYSEYGWLGLRREAASQFCGDAPRFGLSTINESTVCYLGRKPAGKVYTRVVDKHRAIAVGGELLYDTHDRTLFIERAGVVLRWVLIVVCSFIQLFITPLIPMWVFLVALPIAIVYNAAVQLIIARRPSWAVRLSRVTAVGDIIVSLVLIYFGGELDLYLWYFVLLVSHAARFGFIGAVVSPALFSVLYLLGLHVQGIELPFPTIALRVSFFLTTGLVSGYLAREEKRRFLRILNQQEENLRALQQREELRSVLSRYVSYNVVEDLLEHPDRLCIGGARKSITVLFSDIQGFTSLLSHAEPEELIRLLNEYLTAMTEIVFTHNGMVDKFVGDAVIAIFGFIECCDHDPTDAVRCALAMQRRLAQLQQQWRESSPYVFNARIGINSGDAILGNIGSPKRMDYTAIGDTVNIASRLQSIAEINTVVISRSTRDLLGNGFKLTDLGRIQLKGRSEPIEVFQVLEEGA